MGLLDLLKKKLQTTVSQTASKAETKTHGNEKSLSFQDVMNDIAKRKSGSEEKKTVTISKNPKDLYDAALTCISARVVDGIQLSIAPGKELTLTNINQAINYAEQALDGGLSKAANLLANLYANKALLEGKDYAAKILAILNDGVSKGDTASMRSLSNCYSGAAHGLKQDLNKAKELLDMATQYGDPYAFAEYAQFCFMINDLEKGLEYLEEAMSVNSATANAIMGDLYSRGYGVAADPKKAETCFLKAAEGGIAYAYGRIGMLYAQTNPKKASQYFKKGAELGDGGSAWCYAQYLPAADGYKWLKIAYAQGYYRCMFFMTDPSKPVYTFKIKLGPDIIEVKTQSPTKPSVEETAEAYAAAFSKPLRSSLLDSAVYNRIQ